MKQATYTVLAALLVLVLSSQVLAPDTLVSDSISGSKSLIYTFAIKDNIAAPTWRITQEAFEEALALPQGTHTVEVVAKNLPGKTTARQVVIHVDREGPIVTLDELHFDRSGPGGEVRISGSIYDEAGVSDLRINGHPVLTQKGTKVLFTARLNIDADTLELVASDRLGNRTSARMPFSNPQSRLPVLLACADSNLEGHFLAGLFGPKDTSPPVIRLKGWTGTQTVFLKKVYIEGQVGGESTIKRLTINQIPILRRQGRHIFFSHL